MPIVYNQGHQKQTMLHPIQRSMNPSLFHRGTGSVHPLQSNIGQRRPNQAFLIAALHAANTQNTGAHPATGHLVSQDTSTQPLNSHQGISSSNSISSLDSSLHGNRANWNELAWVQMAHGNPMAQGLGHVTLGQAFHGNDVAQGRGYVTLGDAFHSNELALGAGHVTLGDAFHARNQHLEISRDPKNSEERRKRRRRGGKKGMDDCKSRDHETSDWIEADMVATRNDFPQMPVKADMVESKTNLTEGPHPFATPNPTELVTDPSVSKQKAMSDSNLLLSSILPREQSITSTSTESDSFTTAAAPSTPINTSDFIPLTSLRVGRKK